jgi:GDSL-like Lipase/Acylhydrolase family
MNHVVLLGDSIFDNATYVPGGAPVIEQLRGALSENWQATLLAVDGDATTDVIRQTPQLPKDATHLMISCGGNDALSHIDILQETARSVASVLETFADIRQQFQLDYRRMLTHVSSLKKPVAVCTVYDSVPGLQRSALTALSMFNEIILREAFLANLPVIDLRLRCTEPTDYSEISPIEPSVLGGEKIVRAIVHLLEHHDFTSMQSVVYS